MPAKYEKIYQFKISIHDIFPLIWRRIQVPENYTFWDLNISIQDVMGWSGFHLHEFRITNPITGKLENIGIPDEDSKHFEINICPEWERKIKDYFTENNRQAFYIYDFGDSWEHTILLEEILPRVPKKKYPHCLDGERASPPEDCGGIPGYEYLIEVMKNPKHQDYKAMVERFGSRYDPEWFVSVTPFASANERAQLLKNYKADRSIL